MTHQTSYPFSGIEQQAGLNHDELFAQANDLAAAVRKGLEDELNHTKDDFVLNNQLRKYGDLLSLLYGSLIQMLREGSKKHVDYQVRYVRQLHQSFGYLLQDLVQIEEEMKEVQEEAQTDEKFLKEYKLQMPEAIQK